jgi:hypothetical protein
MSNSDDTKKESRLLPRVPIGIRGSGRDKKTVEIERHEVIDILTIIKGFERKLQEKLKQA